jgi:hypothetical protein
MRQAVRLLAKHLARFLPLAPGPHLQFGRRRCCAWPGGSLNQMQTERIGRQDAPVEIHAFEKQCTEYTDRRHVMEGVNLSRLQPKAVELRCPPANKKQQFDAGDNRVLLRVSREELRVRFRERPSPWPMSAPSTGGHRGRSSTYHRTIYPWFKPLTIGIVPHGQGTKTVLMLESKAIALMAWRTFHYPCTARRTIVHVSPWTRWKPIE